MILGSLIQTIAIFLNVIILGYLPFVSSQTILVDSLACRNYSPGDTIQKVFHVPSPVREINEEIAIYGWFKIEEEIYNHPSNTTFQLFTFKPVLQTEQLRGLPSRSTLFSLSFTSINNSTNQITFSTNFLDNTNYTIFEYNRQSISSTQWIFFYAAHCYRCFKQLHRIILPNNEIKQNIITDIFHPKAAMYLFSASVGHINYEQHFPGELLRVTSLIGENLMNQQNNNKKTDNFWSNIQSFNPNDPLPRIGAFFSNCAYTGDKYEITESVQQPRTIRSVFLGENQQVNVCLDNRKQKIAIKFTESIPCIDQQIWEELVKKYTIVQGEKEDTEFCQPRA